MGYGAAADNCPATPPDNPNWTPLERIFNTDCRGTLLGQPAPLLWQAGLDRGCRDPGSTLTIAGNQDPYLLARDALIASDFQGDRKRPAANLALQFAPNDTSEYTFEAFYQGYREEMFNNLHFTFADWWGALGPNPAPPSRCSGHEHHQDAHGRVPVRLQQRRLDRPEAPTPSSTR